MVSRAAFLGHGAHPAVRAVQGLSGLGQAAFTAVFLTVLLIESFVSLLAKGGVFAVEMVCAVLDWVGADY